MGRKRGGIFNGFTNLFTPAGKICTILDKLYYVPGETVTGRVVLAANETIECNAIVLRIKGKEKAEWDEKRTRTEGQGENARQVEYWKEYDSKNKFLDMHVVVSPDAFDCQPGQYVFPFSFQLPNNIPGSFSIANWKHGDKRDIDAEIKYTISATIKRAGLFTPNLKSKVLLTVCARPNVSVQPQSCAKSGRVMFMCCIPKGNVSMEAVFDKNCYCPGELSQIMCTTRNESTVPVNAMRVKLMRVITLYADGHECRIVTTVSENSYSGVQPGQTKENQSLPLQLAPTLYPSTMGQRIKVAYHIDVESDIPWAPDIEIHLPVKIIAPQPAVNTEYLGYIKTFNVPIPTYAAPPVAVAGSMPVAGAMPVANAMPIANATAVPTGSTVAPMGGV